MRVASQPRLHASLVLPRQGASRSSRHSLDSTLLRT